MLSVTTGFKTIDDAIRIGNDPEYGRRRRRMVAQRHQRLSDRPGPPGRTGMDQLLPRYPGPCRRSAALQGVRLRRENHRMMLDHYQETKNLLVSYSTKAPPACSSQIARCLQALWRRASPCRRSKSRHR